MLLARGQICVDGVAATDINQVVDEFSTITLDGKTLQKRSPVYWMLHKPKGVVSATKDTEHTTVIDLLDVPAKDELHIVGRLDFNTTGLLLLTNDGRWSRQLTSPDNKVSKVYHVTLEKTINPDLVGIFSQGIHFPYEDITTRPAKLKITAAKEAELHLVEGRYHQIKRMFARFDNKVTALHRVSVGHIILDGNLPAGQSRALTDTEIQL